MWLFAVIAALSICTADTATAASGDEAMPDNTMLFTVGTRPVYWGEYRFWLTYLGRRYMAAHDLQTITDWQTPQDGVPLKQFLLTSATSHVCEDRAVESQSETAGIALSESDVADLARVREQNIRIYGSDSEYQRIVASMYGSESQFVYLAKIDRLSGHLFTALYGAEGERCDDDCVAQFVGDRGLHNVMYLFRSRLDARGQVLALAKQHDNFQLLARLRLQLISRKSSAEYFAGQISRYSDDKSQPEFPGGRVIERGSMGQQFDQAIEHLPDNKVTDIVSTASGDYLVMKIPLTAQTRIDAAGHTLRYWAAHARLFEPNIAGWCASQPITFADSFQSVDVESLQY